MALADIILIDSQVSPVSHTFSYVGTDAGGRVIRKDLTRTPDLPLLLTLGHKTQKLGGVIVDSHMGRIDNSLMDADGVTVRKCNFRFNSDMDPAIFTDALSDDMTAMLVSLLTEAFVRSFHRGSVG